jgi:zinc protease
MNPRHAVACILTTLLLICSGLAQTRSSRQPATPSPVSRGPVWRQRIDKFEQDQYTTKVILKNGLTVLIHEYHANPVVNILACIKSGSLSDPEGSPGLAYVLQHMMFKQTETRQAGLALKEIKTLGGILSSKTGYLSTSFDVAVPSQQWNAAMEIQADALLNPIFDSEELKKEIERIVFSNQMDSEMPDLFAPEEILELGFGKRSLGPSLIPADEYRKISRDELWSFYKSAYDPANCILVIAGDVSVNEALTQVIKLYDKPKWPTTRPKKIFPPAGQSQFRYLEMHANNQDPLLILGFHLPTIDSEDYPALEVLDAMLGSGEGAILNARLRDQKKEVFVADFKLLPELGYGTIRLETELKNIDRAELAVLTELEILKREKPDAVDLERALAQLEVDFWLRQETVEGRAHALASFEMQGGWKSMNGYVARLRKVKPDDISRVASKYFRLENASLLECLPKGAEKRNLTADKALNTFESLLDSATEEEINARKAEVIPAVEIPAAVSSFKFSEIRYPLQMASILRGPDLFIREDHTSPLIQMGFFFRGGKLFEQKNYSGITALMLRSMLHSTKDKDAARIHRQLEVYGGKITPLVTDDYSGFLLTILSRNINSGLELLEAFIKSPKFDKDEVDRQKQLQLARLRKRIDDRYCYPRNLLKQALFKDYPYGQNEEGTQTSVASLDANAVQTWYQDHVRDIKPLIAILGDTQGTSLSGYFVRNFSGSRFQDVKLPQGFPEALKRKSVVEAKWDKTYSAIVFGLETLPEDDEDALPLAALLGFVFGEGGKLWENLNSQPASAYEIRMEYSSRLRGGSAIIIAFTNPGDEGKTAEEIENAVRRLSDTPISYRDYRTGLNAATGRYRLETQSGISQIQEMVCNALMQKGAGSFQNFPDDIKDVKQEDLNEAVGRIFNADHAVIVRLQGKPASSLLPSSVVHTSD